MAYVSVAGNISISGSSTIISGSGSNASFLAIQNISGSGGSAIRASIGASVSTNNYIIIKPGEFFYVENGPGVDVFARIDNKDEDAAWAVVHG